MAEKADVGEAVGLAGTEQMLDGNAAAGLLQEVFGTEMTANPVRCAHCDQVSMIGELMAFGRSGHGSALPALQRPGAAGHGGARCLVAGPARRGERPHHA